MLAHYYTLCIVTTGTSLLGALIGALGTFAVLRKQSLLGDTMGHAALPGIALMFLATETRDTVLLLFGGACSSYSGALLISIISKTTRLKNDTILGIILSVFFGLGVVLISFIQQWSHAGQSILTKFLFGSAATLMSEDISLILSVSCSVLIVITLVWKEVIAYTFDQKFIYSLGYNIHILEFLLKSSMIIALIIGLQMVGIILISSLLIAPATAARQWTDEAKPLFLLAAFFGAIASSIGSIISSVIDKTPTGPTIVVILSLMVGISFLCGTKKRTFSS